MADLMAKYQIHWIYTYAARHEGDESRRWATVSGPSQEQETSICTTVQSCDRGVPNLDNSELSKSKARQKVDGMDWRRVVDRTRAKGEGSRKPAWIRNQGTPLSSAEVLEGVQMNRWTRKYDDFRKARCSTQFSALLVSQSMFSLPCTYGYQTNYNEWSQCAFLDM